MDYRQSKIDLQTLVNHNNFQDNTETIRKLKHSSILKEDIDKMVDIKAMYCDEPEKINQECLIKCPFLHTFYNDIYNRLKKDELDLSIMYQILDILKKIEDNEIDQHNASIEVGNLLKTLYIDSALKRGQRLDKEHEKVVEKVKAGDNKMSWKQYKLINKIKQKS